MPRAAGQRRLVQPPTIILTGGEPMLRPDIYDIAAYISGLDLPVVMATCGTLLNNETVGRIKQSGIHRISLSLDGATAASHDEFRGAPGAFETCLRGIEAARRGGLDFQINTTVSRHNLAELPEILDSPCGCARWYSIRFCSSPPAAEAPARPGVVRRTIRGSAPLACDAD